MEHKIHVWNHHVQWDINDSATHKSARTPHCCGWFAASCANATPFKRRLTFDSLSRKPGQVWLDFFLDFCGCLIARKSMGYRMMRYDPESKDMDPTMWGPRSIAKLVPITPISLWFMVLITIVTGAYKPTCNWGASHCRSWLLIQEAARFIWCWNFWNFWNGILVSIFNSG